GGPPRRRGGAADPLDRQGDPRGPSGELTSRRQSPVATGDRRAGRAAEQRRLGGWAGGGLGARAGGADEPSRASSASSESVAVASAGRASTVATSMTTWPGSGSPSAAIRSSGRLPASYSARPSASERQRGWRSRIARHPSATSGVT